MDPVIYNPLLTNKDYAAIKEYKMNQLLTKLGIVLLIMVIIVATLSIYSIFVSANPPTIIKQLRGDAPIWRFNGNFYVNDEPINVSIETYKNNDKFDAVLKLNGITREDILELVQRFNG